jgi:hypothetical protein
VIYPDGQNPRARRIHDFFVKAFVGSRIRLVDYADLKLDTEKGPVAQIDGHPTAQAIEQLAQHLVRDLELNRRREL